MRYDFNMHSYDIPDQALFGIMNDIYLTRHIYADQKSGDRNNAGTKIWGFFKEIPKFRTPN